MMNRTVKDWIEALRSGRYVQTEESLRHHYRDEDNMRYCCLGVLCDIVEPEGWTSISTHNRMAGEPSPVIWKHTELPEETIHTLIAMNDSDKASFDEIADYIEQEAS